MFPRSRTIFALCAIAVVVLLLWVWISGRAAFAFRPDTTAHIFPAAVTAEGWQNPEAVRAQELAGTAAFDSFSPENSAYIVLEPSERPPEPEMPPEPEPEPPAEDEEATTTDAVPEEDASEESPLEAEPEPAQEETAPQPEPEPAPEPEAEEEPAPAEEESAPPEEEPADTAPSDEEEAQDAPLEIEEASTTATTTESALQRMLHEAGRFMLTSAASMAFAQTGDVAACAALGVPCRTIELSGFDVGELENTKLRGATINFSFASAGQDADTGRLLLRYYHDGAWLEAGELYLNKEFSNAENGGYFTYTLDDIGSWEELRDLRIVIEYAADDPYAGAELYLDSVWVDASYRERVQDVLQGDTGEPVVPENVTFTLSDGSGSDSRVLMLPDGKTVEFAYADDADDVLFMRADGLAYAARENELMPEGYASIVTMSVTNTGSEPDAFTLYAASPDASVHAIEQFMRNVPHVTAVPIYEHVTEACEEGWEEGEEGYACAQSGETRACVELLHDAVDCTYEEEAGTEEQTTYENGWVAQDIEREPRGAPDMPEGYGAVAASGKPFDIQPGQTLYFRVTLATPQPGETRFFFAAAGRAYEGDLDSTKLKDEASVLKRAGRAAPRINELLSNARQFKSDELPAFTFRFNSQRSLPVRLFNRLFGRDEFSFERARLLDSSGGEEDVPVNAVRGEDGEWSLTFKRQPRAFRPGAYELEFTVKEGSDEYTESVEFIWGTLAVNTNKSIYAPGEEAHLFMAVLDDAGDTVCDAVLGLTITAPDGATRIVPVRQTGECGPNNVIESADYAADYAVGGPGTYAISLMHMTEDGRILRRISDSFAVAEHAPFIIERKGATRIWPVAAYTMELSLTATDDFDGQFIEAVPEDFTILDAGGADSDVFGGAKRLMWNVSLKAGETMHVSYTYDAPDISPYLYLLGPAEVRGESGLPFTEARQWKLSSDAVGNLLLYWDRTYIPTGWTCVSCAGGDAFFQRFIMGSSTPGVNGGATTHTHTATGAIAATGAGGVGNTGGGGADVALNTHTHTYTPTIAAASNLPPYRNLVIIQANTTGEVQIPAGAIALFDVASSSLPAGWFRYSAQDGRFARGEATAQIAGTGGSATHTHAITGTTGGPSATTNASGFTGTAMATQAHTHTVSTTTAAVNNEPPYIEALFARVTATSTAPNGMIGMWTGDTFVGWDAVSNPGGDFADRFVKATTTYGGTGGSQTHSHADITGITTSGPSATANRTAAGTSDSTGAHTHAASVTNFSTADHLPPYRTAVFAKRAGGPPPGAPSMHAPFENEKLGDSTPALEFTGTESGGADLIYEVQWDDDADLDVAPLGDRTSDDESGCSPNCFENTVNGGDSSPFTEGERIRFTIQTPLVSGTTYYWRVRVQRDGEGGNWGDWATTTSFTYVGNTSPSQWFQTEDAQFETGTLDDTETYGANAVRIAVSTPVGALIAYGEGTVQTPRYRLWDGSAWSAEASAQSVGGTIQWVITRPGVTRDEYILGTQDASNDVNVQVFDGTAGTWGNLQEVTTGVSDNTARGFDIAYESQSGDAMVVYCDGDADPSYRIWNGSSWSGATTLNLSLANACEYIKLASDPTSDEIILVARDTAASATDYEAMVWNGSAWGESVTLGSMTDTVNEGIAIEYEESGNQAIIAVSNGNNSSFLWTAWDGVEWTSPTTQALGDDFEWGILKRDAGSDAMALCYADEDDDLGIVRWDGSAWLTNQEIDTGGNTAADGTIDGRPISCEFETSAGRDGYIMVPYSDTTNVRYQFWNGAAWSGESSVSTIGDSWTVGTVRTGDGKILAAAWDDANTQYDFSYWNGTAWSAATTLEGTPSVTATPFREPVHMSAKVYQPATGTITSDPVAFSLVAGQPTWGEALWHATEPAGTDVTVQVMQGPACTTLVPDAALPNNSTGFQATSSPLDLSGLSTTTYSQLCLRATLSSASQNNPSLDDWSISWQRQPYLTQTNFRWYANANAITPTDVWPQGGTDLDENDPISASFAPLIGNVLRLRLNVLTENVSLNAGNLSVKLQYAEDSVCSAESAWHDVGAVGSTTALWRGFDNAGVSDGATLPSVLLSGSDVSGTYEEQNDSAVNPGSASANQETEWDFVLQHNALPGTSYCFRTVTDDGALFNEYDRYPALVTNQRPTAPVLEKPFDNERVASTTPWFDFAGEDPESNDLTYEIQIDNDADFSSPVFDRDSQTAISEFTNVITPSDKDPFTSGQTVRFIPTSALSNNTTYYWRVRARDRTASQAWGEWSDVSSVTITTGTSITTWYQTTADQFDTGTHENTETGSDDVVLSTGLTSGTTTSNAIDFDWKTTGNAWGELAWTDTETGGGDIKYHIEYLNETEWELIPDADLPGNAAGFDDTQPVSLLSLNPLTYNEIRLRANLSGATTPHLSDWTIRWGFAVSQPTQLSLFDNEKTGTTTPSFTFHSEDPEGNDLVYQIQWSATPGFAASTTRESSANPGFQNVASSSDSSPFISGNIVRYTIQGGDALTNGNTYWWRVRARDPGGANVWSVWSPTRSFTVDTTVDVSTWFQSTDEQFQTDALNNIETSGGSAQITSTIREAFTAYAEGTAQVPRFRIWNGTSWSAQQSALSVGDSIRFVEADSAPTRDEYIIATEGTSGGVRAQVYDGGTDSWGNLTEIVAAVPDATAHGYDIAYETDSGDALVVACSGTEATYKVWNGSSWSGSTGITLNVTGNCEWVRLASDPNSDEIIAVFRNDISGATDYQALVWNGSSWGNSMNMGSMAEASDEGIAVEYEESGNQAVVVVSNGATSGFIWNSWNGSSWSGATAQGGQDDFEGGRLSRDAGSDNMALCQTDQDGQIGLFRWSGSGWSAVQQLDATGNSKVGRPFACEFETNGARDGFIMAAYSDTTAARYRVWNGAALSAEATLSTISDAFELRSARTGDGTILVVAYDDANTEYDFSSWNGSSWSAEQVLDATSINTVTPATIPIDIVARRYPSFTNGSVVSGPIDFDDGLGLKWDEASWNATTPGDSLIRVQVEYQTGPDTWALVPDGVLPGNSTGATSSPIDLGSINYLTYNTLRLVANLECIDGDCPSMQDWTLTWSPGLEVSGTAKQYDQTTNVTSGTVAVAVNGDLQAGKTASISGGAWTIDNVTVFPGDTVTVFIQGANDANEAVAVTTYDGIGDVSGLDLIERHLSLGSNDNPTLTNANIGSFDNGASGGVEDIFHEVDGGNDLAACAIAGCADVELWVRSGTTYQPDSASSGNVATHDIEVNGTLLADGNTLNVSGSWDMNGTFTPGASTLVFSATSSNETVDGGGQAFNNVTFGTSGAAAWSLATSTDVNGNLAVNFGTLQRGAQPLSVAGNLSIGASGAWAKGSATTTFDGTGTSNWTDSTASKQDLGRVAIDGSAKVVQLGSNARATDIVIGSDDTLSASAGNFGLEVLGNWTNTNAFIAMSGTVTFAATTTGKTITPGGSNFHNIVFNGAGGNWAFNGNASVNNNFTIATGTVTLPVGTTTIGGNFSVTGGSFMHNNGVVLFNGAGTKTIQPAAYSFYDMTFNGAGSWSFPDGNATSSRTTTIQSGTVTLPANTLAVGGSFLKNGGTFAHNNGTLHLYASNAQSIRLNNSDAFNLTFAGSGSWTFLDTNATTTNTVRFEAGTATLPSGTLAVGGSWLNTGGAFTHNSGTVKFNSTDIGETIQPGGSWFGSLLFDNAGGGWTITQNATSTGAATLANAASFTQQSGTTLAVGGAFQNALTASSTSWTGSTLFLNSGTSFSINTKASEGDAYGALAVGPNTDVKMWHSSASAVSVDASGSLYSQDHAGADGDLYIWGDYHASGNEYWSYASDFDGAALGGSPRQANVRFAPGAHFSLANSELQVIGAPNATTTLANQGSGSYGFSISGGTTTMQRYQVRNTDAAGIQFSGTPHVVSLDDGDFELSVNGGAMISLAGSVISVNPALEIQRARFGAAGGVSSGFNVSATTSASSYWWFRNHAGAYAGEAFDDDVDGDPGIVRWDDSAFSITVSGTVYSDDGVTPMGSPTCDGTTQNVRVVVDGGASFTGSCDSGDGTYSVAGVEFTGDATVAAYLDTNGGAKAVSVTRTPTADITGFDLYADTLITRHESAQPLTLANLAFFDSSDDSDVFFAASSSLAMEPGNELHVWTGDTFAPGGNIALAESGLHLAPNATFAAAGTEAHTIGGDFIAESGAAFNAASSTLSFTSASARAITLAVPLSFNNLSFDGSGSWNLSGATTTVLGSFAANAGTLSGTGDIRIENGSMTGDGAIAMSGGTVNVRGTGTIGGNTAWQFHHLLLGDATSTHATAKAGSGAMTVSGVLTIAANHTLQAGSSSWTLSGGGRPLVMNGTFDVQSAPFTYSATTSTEVADETYQSLTLAPAGAGSPTYAILGGTLETENLTIGGANAVTVSADVNDPTLEVNGDLLINSGSTLVASNVGIFEIGGSWQNSGTFTHSGSTVLFNSDDTGETIAAGASPFYDVAFDGTGGWAFTANATSTHDLDLVNAAAFAVQSGATLSVGGAFENGVGGGATDWTGSTLYLYATSSYSINDAVDNGDAYGTLAIASSTDVRMWNSSAASVNVDPAGSLYSQDHAGADGDLYIWGAYERASGSDYWSYATDFDGASLGGGARPVDVRIAPNSSVTLSGGILDMLGGAGATTTVDVQGSGTYAMNIAGGTFNAQRYSFRNLGLSGLAFSGAPTIQSLSDGDFELAQNGASLMTVAGSVIDANPLKVIQRNRFATSSGATTGTNVTATGSSVSSWKFNLHYGEIAGEAFDDDPAGDPGYLRWDDSAAQITISGTVYADEGTTVSGACDGSPVVMLMIQGAGALSAPCDNVTGAYEISGINYNPGDVLTVFLNTDGGARAANIAADPNTNIANMDLYEDRVIVRHEDTAPITIADMAVYDSDEDADIPFDAEDATSTDSLILPPDMKLIVWAGKTFAPAGDITLESGGSGNDWDGSLEVQAGATFSAAGTQTHTIGGSLIVGSGGSIVPAQSSFVMNATTTGKTIQLQGSSLYDLTFDGPSGNWAFAGGGASIANDFTIATGTVTLGTATTTVGGSFQNTGGVIQHNNGLLLLIASTTGKTVRFGGSNLFDVTFDGPGSWAIADTNATSSGDVLINAGAVTLPNGIFAVGGSFETMEGASFAHGGGTLKLTSSASGRVLQGASSFFNNIFFSGSGDWLWNDATSSARDILIQNGSTTLPISLTVSGSFQNTGGSFFHNDGAITFTATTTGKTVRTNGSWFHDVTFAGAGGGWTLADSATSTGFFALQSGAGFTLASGQSLTVNGPFTNLLNGAATTWTGSTLILSGASSTVNTKATGDSYNALIVGPDTDIRMWNSAASSTSVNASGSLYSQDHAGADGDLYIWGAYERSAGAEYWSAATDFDGVALDGGARQVDVRIASGASVTLSGGSLDILGTASSTTSIDVQGGSGAYAFDVTGGTLNAQRYSFRHLDGDGLALSGTPSIISLANGDFELAQSGGAMITLAGSVIDANASKQIQNVAFATSSGVSSGYNVALTGTTTGSWMFLNHSGNYDGEAFDSDGPPEELCGAIRWSDSACLFISQEHYRWRNDDGAEGAPASEWYDGAWAKRKRVGISNETAQAYTNLPVKMTVAYDSDMQADFDDLRFTDDNGTTSLDYWIEEFTSASQATVWVEVPSLPGSGEAAIYMYYDNNSVLTTGDGEATFKFFDDFEDGDISEYSANAHFSVGGSFNYTGDFGLGASDPEERDGIYRTGSLTGQGNTIRFFQYVDASFDDEPCAFFGVGGSGNNYALCLDQYPDQRLIIAKDVTSNDGSGTVLASTTVDYDTAGSGWYEVVVDWLAGGLIDARVYDPSSTLFATLGVTDGSHASGGVGFGFWAQHGGWDFYSVRPYTATPPTVVFGAEGGNSGASWKTPEDALFDGGDVGENIRLRFSIQNTGAALFGQLFRLQVAPKGASLSCEAVPDASYNDVPTTAGGCGSAEACMTTSAQFTNNAPTAGLLSYPADLSFDAGSILEDPSNQTASSSVAAFSATEVEYNFQMTGNAVDNSYCFRVINDDQKLENYQRVAELVMKHGPIISGFTLNGAAPIALVEGATTTVYATGTVTDLNGFADIASATSTIYRSGVGASCAADANSCYPVGSCALTDCAGVSCTLQCSADIVYHADPTDIGDYEGDTWLARVQVYDATGLQDIVTSLGVELQTLFGLSVDSDIAFDDGGDPGIVVGSDTGAVNASTTVMNTGNSNIDLKLAGTDLTGGGNPIQVQEQKYATSTFTYAACAICNFLTGDLENADPLGVDLPKPTSTSTPITDEVYWGINIPVGTGAGAYSGTNFFEAVAPGGS